MDEEKHTPLPPGVMPSRSNEDLYAQLQAESETGTREERLFQAADSSSDEAQSSRRRKKKVASKDKKVVDVHPNESAEDGQNPAAAWNSPHMARSENMAHDQPSVPRRYRLPTEDLDEESEDSDVQVESDTLPDLNENEVVESSGPEVPKKSEGLRKDLMESFTRPTSPPRPMSPFKRHNKVTPFVPSGEFDREGEESQVVSDGDCTFEEIKILKPKGKSSQPKGTVIANRQASPTLTVESTVAEVEVAESHPSEHVVRVDVEPLYSPVIKPRKAKKGTASELNASETPDTGCSHTDLEFVHNPGAVSSSSDVEVVSGKIYDIPSPAKITPVGTLDRPNGQRSSDHSLYASLDPVDPNELSQPRHGERQMGHGTRQRRLKQLEEDLRQRRREETDSPGSRSSRDPRNWSDNYHMIHYAAMNGNKKQLLEIIHKMKKDDINIDTKDIEGRTALMHAVHNEHSSCIKALINEEADINATAFDGSTALHQAAYMNSPATVALLLGLGADGMIKDNDGRLPIHWATNNRSPQCIRVLLDKVLGLEVDAKDYVGMAPLMWAAYNNQPQNIALLMELGANVALQDIDGMSAIHWAVQKSDIEALRTLIKVDATKYRDKRGKTVMHFVAEQGCAKAVSLIRAVRPSSVDDCDVNGRTPLHWATVCEKPDVIRALLESRADPSLQDSSGCTPLDHAISRGLQYCTLLLSQHMLPPEEGNEQLSFERPQTGVSERQSRAQHIQSPPCSSEDVDYLHFELSQAQILRMLSGGCWLYKFTGKGRGPLHKRFFWVNLATGKICWSTSQNPSDADIKSDDFTDIQASASSAIRNRKDFDPIVKHEFAFTIVTAARTLDVVAPSADDYKLWQKGLGLLKKMGSTRAAQVVAED